MVENNYSPTDLGDYDGKQAYLGSGRVVIDAKDDSIFLVAKESVGLNAQTINIEGDEYVILDGKKLYLGINSINEAQPILLGDNTYKLITKIINSLSSLSDDLATTISTPTGTPLVSLTKASAKLKSDIVVMKKMVEKIKSKKGFVE